VDLRQQIAVAVVLVTTVVPPIYLEGLRCILEADLLTVPLFRQLSKRCPSSVEVVEVVLLSGLEAMVVVPLLEA
jgi:hypothetical protein